MKRTINVSFLHLAAVTAGLAMCTSFTAHAQPADWPKKGFVSLGGGAQLGERTLAATVSVPRFDETAELTVDYPTGQGGLLDVSGGVTVWGSLAVGVGFTRFDDTADIRGTGTVPNPLFFDRATSVSFEEPGFSRREIGVHFSATYTVAMSDRFLLSLSAGPTMFRLRQDLVSDVELGAATAPLFDNGEVIATTAISTDGTGWGGHVGVDGTFLLTEQLGIGGFFRFATGSVDLSTTATEASADVGGPQLGAAVKLFF